MPRVLFLLFCCFVPASLSAQTGKPGNKTLDSLKTVLERLHTQKPSLQRDSAMIMTFRSMTYEIPAGDTAQYNLLKFQFRQLLENTQWNKAKAHYDFMSGTMHLFSNELYSAFYDLEQAMLGFRKYNDYENYLKVNNKFIPLMSWNIIENQIPKEAQQRYLQYIKDALSIPQVKKDTAVWANIRITLAGYYIFVLKDYHQCYQNAGEVIKLIENKNRRNWFDYYYISKLGQSLSLLNMGREKEGKAMLDEIIRICQQNKEINEARYVLSQIGAFAGRYYLEKKDYRNALELSLLGEQNANFLNFPYYNNVLNKTLYQTYKALNQPARAFAYLEKVRKYEEEAEAKKLNQNFGEWQVKYEDEKQKNKIKTLENENLKRATERDEWIRNTLIASLLIGLGIGGYVFWNNKQLRNKNQELKAKNDEISGAIFKGQTIERKRVASELHDNLNSKIVALKWRFEALDTSKYSEYDQKALSDFINVLDDIYMDVRLISHNLLPIELETQGVVIALQKLLNNISNRHITFHFLTEGVTKRLDPQLEHELYNIALELINNILKHAQATQAWVSLTQQDDRISLTVSDNGKGIDLSQTANGVGLRNVNSRVDNLNGRLLITRQDTHGTHVQIDITI
jgi:signal transduction histidine kinase